MATAHPSLPLSPADRLGLALLLAASLHALAILGIGFEGEKRRQDRSPPALDVILVHSRSEAPEKADYLAQENQRGGGDVRERVRPSSPFPNPRPSPERGRAEQTREASAPPPAPERALEVITAPGAAPEARRPAERPAPPRLPTADELVEQGLEIARLSAEIRQSQQTYAQMPRHEYVTANTRKHDTALYEEAWREKIERLGNLNYPEEARRRNLSGSLIVDVALRPDGSLLSVKVLRSSGNRVLDDGALRIVRLASPFAPFPDSMRRRMDVLHITRTWQFDSESRSVTSRGEGGG